MKGSSFERFAADISVGHEDVFHPLRLIELRGVVHKLIPDHRLVVGEGEADVPLCLQILRQAHEALGRHLPAHGLLLGDLMVLAEGAFEIAAEAARRKDQAARGKIPQGLFFDGVQGEGGYHAVVERIEHAPLVFPGEAEAPAPFFDQAAVGAQPAPHGVPLALPKKRLFHRPSLPSR